MASAFGAGLSLPALAEPAPSFDTGKGYALIYLAAWDCPPCIQWQNTYKEEFFDSPLFKKLSFRKIDSPRIKEAYEARHWPSELEPLRQFHVDKGWRSVPRFIFLNNGKIVATNSGISGWQNNVWPAIQKTVKV
jgi:hypothetical protein